MDLHHAVVVARKNSAVAQVVVNSRWLQIDALIAVGEQEFIERKHFAADNFLPARAGTLGASESFATILSQTGIHGTCQCAESVQQVGVKFVQAAGCACTHLLGHAAGRQGGTQNQSEKQLVFEHGLLAEFFVIFLAQALGEAAGKSAVKHILVLASDAVHPKRTRFADITAAHTMQKIDQFAFGR